MEMKTALIIALVAVLLVVSTVQALQLSQLKEKVTQLSSQPVSTTQSTTAKIKQNLNNLPTMVGGC